MFLLYGPVYGILTPAPGDRGNYFQGRVIPQLPDRRSLSNFLSTVSAGFIITAVPGGCTVQNPLIGSREEAHGS